MLNALVAHGTQYLFMVPTMKKIHVHDRGMHKDGQTDGMTDRLTSDIQLFIYVRDPGCEIAQKYTTVMTKQPYIPYFGTQLKYTVCA